MFLPWLVGAALFLSPVTTSQVAAAGICGAVSFNSTLGAYSVAGVTLDAGIVNADARLRATLQLAAASGTDVCVEVTRNSVTQLPSSITVDAAFNLCGTVSAVTGAGATVNGVLVPSALLSSQTVSALQLAMQARAAACVDLTVVNTSVAGTVNAIVCATVDAISASTITLNGIVFQRPAGSHVDATITAGARIGVQVTAHVDGRVAVVRVWLASCSDAGTGGTAPIGGGDGGTAPIGGGDVDGGTAPDDAGQAGAPSPEGGLLRGNSPAAGGAPDGDTLAGGASGGGPRAGSLPDTATSDRAIGGEVAIAAAALLAALLAGLLAPARRSLARRSPAS